MATSIETPRSTILYGMMGAGKSTLGLGLAYYLSQGFVDTDQLIEAAAGITCAEIVTNPLLDFGDIQKNTLLGYLPDAPAVIATGGSVAMYPDITRQLGTLGTSIFIKVEPDVLEARLSVERIAALNNPKGLSFQDLYRERMPMYEEAAVHTLEIGDELPQHSLARLISLVVDH